MCGRIVMRPYERFCGAAVGASHDSPVSHPGRFCAARLFKPPLEGAPLCGRIVMRPYDPLLRCGRRGDS